MYVTHKPQRCPKNPDRKKDASASASTSGGNNSNLTLKQNLKAALSTNLCMSDEDIDKLLAQAEEPGN